MAIIDVITYHNEKDLFDLRYNALKDYVDEFVVVESKTAFNGYPKPLYFEQIKGKYPKVRYYLNEEQYTPEEIEQARSSPNTGGYPRWMHEFLQKEQLQKAISHLKDDDIVIIGDVDEIWDSEILKQPIDGIKKLKLRVYTYFLNLRSNEEFWGPIIGKYKDIKGQCLNHLRNLDPNKNTNDYYGWHFTNQGGFEAVRNKIFDQYNPEVFGEQTYEMLADRFGKIDYVGRDFKFLVDESEWPEYLKNNKVLYKHLCK